MQKRLIASAILLLVAILITFAFIFTNSFKSKAESSAQSDFFADILKPIMDPDNSISEENFTFFVRKFAHFIEFALLGAELAALSLVLTRLFKKSAFSLFCFPSFFSLCGAVTDEYIQSFMGRGSCVSDVLIDFSGSLTAILIVFLIFFIVKRRKKSC